MKVQEIHGEEYFQSKNDKEKFLNDESDLQMLEEEDAELSYRSQKAKSKEITRLVNTINDLAVLFKDLSVLVVEQGTILDRIDYNIECAHKDVKKAVVHLEKTRDIEKSARSKGVIICLSISILICVIFMVIKHRR